MHCEVVASKALAARAAIWVADRIWTSVAAREIAHLAVSGGSTPQAMFNHLAALPLPWEQVHVWQVDERVVPDGDNDRNASQLNGLFAAGATIHLLPVTAADLAQAAETFAKLLPDRFDVVHLGLGDDGHTASWPPGDPVVERAAPVAVVGPYNGRLRFTLTPPVVNAARERMFLVAGATKTAMLHRLLDRDPAIPAVRVTRLNTTVLTDLPILSPKAPISTTHRSEPSAR